MIGDEMLKPTPLYFKVPFDVRERTLRENCAELGPDFLCFETFYQAVASTWPKEMAVIDVGGFVGLQGWLFDGFRHYICVDNYEMRRLGDEFPIPTRCELPSNGLHVMMDGFNYVRGFRGSEANLDSVLFVCSAVPVDRIRREVSKMPNSVVWYPGKPMVASGAHASDTIIEFDRLTESRWRNKADEVVWDAIERAGLYR